MRKKKISPMQIVTVYGAMWARNTTNIRKIPSSKKGGQGVYILFDGSMPVYVGKGNISARLTSARRSKRRGQSWDRFSWYGLTDPRMMHDIEVLLLRVFPTYLRSLTRQDGKFVQADNVNEVDKIADVITRKSRSRSRSRKL
jgi:hypothetical protein